MFKAPKGVRDILPAQVKTWQFMENTIRQVLEQLGVPEVEVAFAFVNSKRQKLDESLSDGDELGIFPPIAGG